jgi:hypothetical protein
VSPPPPPTNDAETVSAWPTSSVCDEAETAPPESAGKISRAAAGEVAATPFESVTVAVTEYVPAPVGAQLTLVEFEVAGEQPLGSPDHVTVSAPEPGVDVSVNVTASPASIASTGSLETLVTTSDVAVGTGATVIVPEYVLTTVRPRPSVIWTLGVYAPTSLAGTAQLRTAASDRHAAGTPLHA